MRGGSVFLTVIFSLMIESAKPQSTGGVLNPLHEDAAAARAGKSIYEKRCQECHGGDARGGRGPALATGSFQVRADDRYLFDTIKNGTPGTAMPPFETRSDTNIWQVVTYLRSLAGTVREEVVSGDVIAGEEVFRGKGGCLSCHQVHGEGGRIGPDLSRIGKWVGQAIREVIVDPNGVQGRKDWTVRVAPFSCLIGRRVKRARCTTPRGQAPLTGKLPPTIRIRDGSTSPSEKPAPAISRNPRSTKGDRLTGGAKPLPEKSLRFIR